MSAVNIIVKVLLQILIKILWRRLLLSFVAGTIGRVVYFPDIVEKIDIPGFIEILLQLLHFAIALLICYDFFSHMNNPGILFLKSVY